MADKEIKDLTDGGAAQAGDVVHAFRSPNSRKVTLGGAAGLSVGTTAGTVAAGNHTHADATTSAAGFLSATDKQKLDGIEAGAQVNAVTSVAGRTGAVTLSSSDISGLGNSATRDVGTTAGTVAAGDDSRIAGAVQKALDTALSAGYTTTAADDGTKSSGTYTPSPAGGNIRKIVNGGAFTLAAPSASGDYTMIIQITNNSSAGAITLSGFTKSDGDSFTTTDGHDFLIFITKANGFTHAQVVALQ